MGKDQCDEYRRTIETIRLNNEAATAVRDALAAIPEATIPDGIDPKVKQWYFDALRSYREANAALNEILNEHCRNCRECQST